MSSRRFGRIVPWGCDHGGPEPQCSFCGCALCQEEPWWTVAIEDRLITSEFIDQVMVVGDDKKSLGALIVPHFDHVRKKLPGIPDKTELWNFDKSVRDLFKGEITRLISRESGFKAFEVIPGSCFYIVPRQFDPDTEMTRTLKLKRNVIKDNFAQDIDAMY
jgi:long-chain acyl-CoA synthetase